MKFFNKQTFWLTEPLSRFGNHNSKCNKKSKNPTNLDNNISIENQSYKTTTEEKPIKNGANGEVVEIDMLDTSKYFKPAKPNWFLRKVSILNWICQYDREKAVADLIAGITLGMTIIPQAIAYAALAGVTSEIGLYSAFVGSIIYVFVGTIPQVSIGPTSVMSLLTLQYCSDKPFEFVFILAFMAGLVEFLMGIFKLGILISFIPGPVVKAFTSGTAAIIVLVQMKTLLGLKTKGITTFIEMFQYMNLYDAAFGVTCCIILLLMRQLAFINFKNQNQSTQRLKKIFWLISISRNALVVFVCALITYIWVRKRSLEAIPYGLSAKVASGIPTIKLPPFAFEHNNQTYVFTDICRELGSAILVVPLIGACANVAIAKAFVKDGTLDASQEMLALGLCNIGGSFFSAMPTCGAFTRSAVSQASGVRTPMAGIYTGIIVLLALSVLTPYFQYIPKTTLAAVLIIAVVFMIDFKPVTRYWQTNKRDFFSWTGCFIVCIFAGFELGLLTGVIINIVCILICLGMPKLEKELKEINGLHYILVKPESDVYYAGVDFLRIQIGKICAFYRFDFPVVLDCSRFMLFDATFVDMLNATAKELNGNDVQLILQNVKPELQLSFSKSNNLIFCDEQITAATFLTLKQ